MAEQLRCYACLSIITGTTKSDHTYDERIITGRNRSSHDDDEDNWHIRTGS